jgi:hypothetical protein
MPSLFSLPEKVRDLIWSMVFLGDEPNLQVLVVSRQVHKEVEKYPYKRPVSFQTQLGLYTWLDEVAARNLHHVNDLSFGLVLEDGKSEETETKHTSAEVQLVEEMNQLSKALESVSNIRTLAVLKDGTDQSPQYCEFYDMALKNICGLFPNLENLTFHGNDTSLDFLKHVPNLKVLRFTGFSKSSPMEMVAIISRLRHLREIEIIPSTAPSCSANEGRQMPSRGVQTLTREAVRSIRGLQAFSICEFQKNNPGEAVFFNRGFLQAVDSVHRFSLRKLCISLDFTPDPATQSLFYASLVSSHIKHLSIIWFGLNTQVLEFLPSSLVTLCIPPLVLDTPHQTMLELAMRKDHFPALSEVTLLVEETSTLHAQQVCLRRIGRMS